MAMSDSQRYLIKNVADVVGFQTQVDLICNPGNPVIPRNSAQFRTIPRNSAQFRATEFRLETLVLIIHNVFLQ